MRRLLFLDELVSAFRSGVIQVSLMAFLAIMAWVKILEVPVAAIFTDWVFPYGGLGHYSSTHLFCFVFCFFLFHVGRSRFRIVSFFHSFPHLMQAAFFSHQAVCLYERKHVCCIAGRCKAAFFLAKSR